MAKIFDDNGNKYNTKKIHAFSVGFPKRKEFRNSKGRI